MDEESKTCPRCGSEQTVIGKKGFGIWNALIGAGLLGPIGLIGGLLGSNKPKVSCLNCGHSWERL